MADGVKKKAIPLLAMVLFFIASWGFDQAKAALKNFRSSTFIMTSLWVDLLIDLVFAGIVVLMVWLVLFKFKKFTLVGWVFVIIGLLALILSSPFRMYVNPLARIDIPPRYVRDDYSIIVQGYYSLIIAVSGILNFPMFGFITKASALITALGGATFLRKSS